MSALLSRRAGRVMNLEPIVRLDPVERGELAHAVNQAVNFGDLSPEHQRLIVEAESTRERLLAEQHHPRSA